mgnify:FL=1
MSTNQSSSKASTRGLKIALFMVITLFGAVALVLGLCLNKKTELAVLPENNIKTEKLDTSSLLSNNGWNDTIALRLYQSLSNSGDNIALGNAGGVIASRVISLGGYSWSVVYKQNGIVTLYANEPVAYLSFDNASVSYRDSAIREYLNNEFYAELVQKIGFSGFENMIVPFGSNELYYQINGAQAIPLETVSGEEIENCDGIANDKIWLPSAYEVGGFGITEKSPKARVNSFKTIKNDGFSVNSGLWNLSNDSRLKVDDALLRSTSGNGVNVLKNGVITSGNVSGVYAIRPCFNMVMPEVEGGVLLNAADTTYQNSSLLASSYPSFATELHKYTTETSGTTFTPKTGSTTVNGVTYTYAQLLLSKLAQAVNLGHDMSGCTFNLNADVDMSVFTIWSPIGRSGFVFSGVFNGNGYKISNLCSAGSGFVGLFGYVSGSAANVKNVAVVDSSWYTTNDNVGSIVGILANSATVESCYSECGISGGSYVGGIVGKSTSTSTIKNCYNKNGISGIDYVGGIIGNNAGSTITTCYNVGAVTGNGSNIGGIVGKNQSGTFSGKSVFNSANAPAGVSVSNVAGASYTDMQGKKTSSGITKPTAMNTTDWVFGGSPWTISTTENDRLPMLKVFIKKVTINVRANDGVNKVSVNGGTYGSTATLTVAASSSTKVTVSAQASFTGTNHYKLTSWNLFKSSVGDNIVSTGVTYAAAGSATTSGNYKIFSIQVTADDSYNLEAVFEKLYYFKTTPVFNGFSDSATYAASEFSCTMSTTAFETNWYPAGTIATLKIGSPSGRYWKFSGLTGSGDASTWTAVSAGSAGSFVTSSTSGTYEVTVGHSSVYVAKDTYTIRPVFDRYYKVTITNNVPTASDAPSMVTQMVISNPSKTVKSSDSTKVAEMKYDGTIAASVVTAESSYSNYFDFTSWQLLNGSTEITKATTATASAIKVASTQANAVIDLTLKANFSLATKTINIKELVGSTETAAAGIVVLSTSSTLTTVSKDTYPLSVLYGTTVYVYILPSFATGYMYSSFSGNTVTPTAVGSVGLLRTSITATSSATYNVVYSLANKFNITFTATLDGAASSGVFTFNPTSYSEITISASLSAAKVTNAADKYVLSSVAASYNGKSGSIKTATRPSSGYVAQTSNNVFEGLGSTQTVATLLSKIGATAVYNNYNITVTVNFISIVRTITVKEVWTGKSSTGTATTITHAKAYTIQDNTAKKSVTGQGTLNNEHTLTANPGAGYKVTSITAAPTSITLTKSMGTTWGSISTATFTLSDNISITINYEVRTYKITAADSDLTSGEAVTVNSNYTFKIGGAVATATGKSIYVNYGSTASISGYAILQADSTNTAQKHELRSITVKSGTTIISTITDIAQEWSKVCNDNYDDITVTFNYITLQKVKITLNDAASSATTANKVLVILKSNVATNPNIVILATKGQADIYADCVLGGGYTVSAIVPVYVNGTISGTTNNVITIATTSEISVTLKQDLSNGSVFASDIFG